MVEEKVKKNNRGYTMAIFFGLLLIGMIIYAAYQSDTIRKQRAKMKEAGDLIQTATEKYIRERGIANDILREKQAVVNENAELKHKMLKIDEVFLQYKQNFKSATSNLYDANLKYAIVSYIKKYYSRSSSVVAISIAENITILSKKHNVAPDLIVGIMEEESWFNPQATNKKSGAIGLMQVMEEWIPKLKLKSRRDLYEIDINIESGIKVFKIHVKENKGSISKGLYHYVNGDKSYIDKVYRAMGRFTIHRASLNQPKLLAGIALPPSIIMRGTLKKWLI